MLFCMPCILLILYSKINVILLIFQLNMTKITEIYLKLTIQYASDNIIIILFVYCKPLRRIYFMDRENLANSIMISVKVIALI